jgi:Trypsin
MWESPLLRRTKEVVKTNFGKTAAAIPADRGFELVDLVIHSSFNRLKNTTIESLSFHFIGWKQEGVDFVPSNFRVSSFLARLLVGGRPTLLVTKPIHGSYCWWLVASHYPPLPPHSSQANKMMNRPCRFPLSAAVFLLIMPFVVVVVHGASSSGRRRRTTQQTRIVGGVVADPAKYPFFGHSSPLWCGGSLIHADLVVTAAHCSGRLSDLPFLFGGGVRLDQSVALDTVRVDGDPYSHPRFNADTYENDISILKLRRAVVSTVSPVPWMTNTADPVGPVVAIGFGDTTQGGVLSDTLLQVSLPVVPTATCNSSSYYNGDVFGAVMLCAGEQGKDACQGNVSIVIFYSCFVDCLVVVAARIHTRTPHTIVASHSQRICRFLL